jgi:hypothetical protein
MRLALQLGLNTGISGRKLSVNEVFYGNKIPALCENIF